MTLPIEKARREFWAYFAERDPVVGARPHHDTNVWHPMTQDGLGIMSFGISQETGSTIFLRGKLHADHDTAAPLLRPRARALEKALITAFEAEGDVGSGRYLRKRSRESFAVPRNWPEIARWFTACRLRHANVQADLIEVSA